MERHGFVLKQAQRVLQAAELPALQPGESVQLYTPANWQPLRDGDVIESGDGLRIHFRT